MPAGEADVDGQLRDAERSARTDVRATAAMAPVEEQGQARRRSNDGVNAPDDTCSPRAQVLFPLANLRGLSELSLIAPYVEEPFAGAFASLTALRSLTATVLAPVTLLQSLHLTLASALTAFESAARAGPHLSLGEA